MSFRRSAKPKALRKSSVVEDSARETESAPHTDKTALDASEELAITPSDLLSVAKMKRRQRKLEMVAARLSDPDTINGTGGRHYLEPLTESGIKQSANTIDEAMRQHSTASLFTSSVAAAAAKKRMEEFVEEELRKKRGGETVLEVLDKLLPAVVTSEANILLANSVAQSKRAGRSGGGEAQASAQTAARTANETAFLADTTKILEKLPEELKSSGREKQAETVQEGNIQASAALLTAVPEVDLGIEAKLRNYELTERARMAMNGKSASRGLSDSRSIGLPTGNWMYGKHQAAAKRKATDDKSHRGGSKQELATDNAVAAKFRRKMLNRKR